MEIFNTEDKSTDVAVPPVKVDLGGILWDLVDTGKYEEALSELKHEKYEKFVITNSMDLIPVLTLKLQDSSENAAQECLENMMMHVASVAKVKEVMIVLLEETQTFKSQQVYRVMLQPMQVALGRLVSTNCSPTLFTWTFKSVLEHLGRMELPSGYNLEGKERMLLDSDPSVIALSDNIYHVSNFFKFFHQQIVLGKLVFNKKIPNTKIFMAKTMLRLFDKPLTFLDIYCNVKDVENTIHRTASKFVSMIVRLKGNPILFFSDIKFQKVIVDGDEKIETENSNDSNDSSDDDLSSAVSQTSLATFFYCIFHQQMSIEAVPRVYSPVYKFISCLPLISQLLAKTEHLALHKGLLLAKSLTDCINTGTVGAEYLDAPCHYYFNKLLVGSMTMVDNKELRITALQLFRRYVSNFDFNGRYRLFDSLLQSANHAGVLSFIITEIKQNIQLSLKEEAKIVNGTATGDPATVSKFTGSSLWKLVYRSCSLPDGERTDMLDWSEKILAVLNLLIFLLIRGNKICQNLSNEGDDQCSFSSTFQPLELPRHVGHFKAELFEPLQRGLQISREHYELKLKGLNEKTPACTDTEIVKLSLGDSLLPGLTPEQEKEVIALALSRFDLISCVLARTEATATELLATCKPTPEPLAMET